MSNSRPAQPAHIICDHQNVCINWASGRCVLHLCMKFYVSIFIWLTQPDRSGSPCFVFGFSRKELNRVSCLLHARKVRGLHVKTLFRSLFPFFVRLFSLFYRYLPAQSGTCADTGESVHPNGVLLCPPHIPLVIPSVWTPQSQFWFTFNSSFPRGVGIEWFVFIPTNLIIQWTHKLLGLPFLSVLFVTSRLFLLLSSVFIAYECNHSFVPVFFRVDILLNIRSYRFDRYHCRYQRFPTQTCRPTSPLYRTSLRRTSAWRTNICWSRRAPLARRRGKGSSGEHPMGAPISACTTTIASIITSTTIILIMEPSSSSNRNNSKPDLRMGVTASRPTELWVHNRGICRWVSRTIRLTEELTYRLGEDCGLFTKILPIIITSNVTLYYILNVACHDTRVNVPLMWTCISFLMMTFIGASPLS